MGNQCCPSSQPASLSIPTGSSPAKLVTHEELVEVLSSIGLGDQSGTTPVRRTASINMSALETILLVEEEASGVEELNGDASHRKGPQQGMGFVTKDVLKESMMRISFRESQSQEGLGERNPDSAASKRKPTGAITKEKLLALLAADDEEAEEDGLATDMAAKVRILEGDHAGRADSDARAPAARAKARKGTGFVTKDKLRKVLAAAGEEQDPRQDGLENGTKVRIVEDAGKGVGSPTSGGVRSKVRKGTGFVNKDQLQDAIDGADESEE
jgi:hypothetical protein